MRFLIGFLAFISVQASAQVLFDGSFESGTLLKPDSGKSVDTFFYGGMGPNCNPISSWVYDSAQNDNRLVTSPVRYGKYANAQTVRYNCDYRFLNGGTLQKPRQSIKIQPETLSMDEGKEYWFAFSFMLPTDWVSDYTANRDNIFQLVKEGNISGARASGPNVINFEEVNGRFEFQLHDQNGVDGLQTVYSWPTVTNEWQDIVVHFKPCRAGISGCSGFMEIYLGNAERRANGSHMTPVYKMTGSNTQAISHTIALNLYKYNWHCAGATRSDYDACMLNPNPTRSTAPRTIYFDELKVGDASSSLTEIAPYFNGAEAVKPPAAPSLEVN